MISITKQGDSTSYGVNEYVVDTTSELNQIKNAGIGSIAYSIEDGNEYIKTNNGIWILKQTSSGGASPSGPIDLPDNILYSYEMTEEEFWGNYSNGTLNDGLYDYNIATGLDIISKDFSDTCDFGNTTEPLLYNNTIWVYGYADASFVQIDEKGNLIDQIISDKINFSPFRRGHKLLNSSIGIDDNGYIYFGGKGNALIVDTKNKQTNLIDLKTASGNYYETWLFRQYSYSDTKELYDLKNKLSQNFKVKDGGTFGVLVGVNPETDNSNLFKNSRQKIGYFKNGEKMFEIDSNGHYLD